VVKESWRLRAEALPLLAGLDPDRLAGMAEGLLGDAELDALWDHACRCVAQGLLPVINGEDDPGAWRIRPFDAFRWAAVSRVHIPEGLAALLDFIDRTVKKPGAGSAPAGPGQPFAPGEDDRVRVLGAAIALLAADPGRCVDGNGRACAGRMARLISEKGAFWFGDQVVKLQQPDIRALLERWLATVPPGSSQ